MPCVLFALLILTASSSMASEATPAQTAEGAELEQAPVRDIAVTAAAGAIWISTETLRAGIGFAVPVLLHRRKPSSPLLDVHVGIGPAGVSLAWVG